MELAAQVDGAATAVASAATWLVVSAAEARATASTAGQEVASLVTAALEAEAAAKWLSLPMLRVDEATRRA